MENYDRDDAFFASVNRNKNVSEKVATISGAVDKSFDDFYKKTARANAAVARANERKKQLERKNTIRRMAIVGAIVATLAAGMTANVVYGDEISTTISAKVDFDDAIDILANHHLLVFNARKLSDGIMLNDNSVEQYKNLNITSMEELYVYKYESKFSKNDNFDKEMDKLVKSVSYYDNDGNICFYDSFDNFLSINGYANEEEFKDAAKESILTKYRAGEIKPYFYDSWGTSNSISVKKGK